MSLHSDESRSIPWDDDARNLLGSDYAHRATNWPTFVHYPSSEASIARFDDRQAAEAELARVRGYAANARLREVD